MSQHTNFQQWYSFDQSAAEYCDVLFRLSEELSLDLARSPTLTSNFSQGVEKKLITENIGKTEFDATGATLVPLAEAMVTAVTSLPPDGGTIAWLQVVGSWCVWFATLGLLNSFGIFQEYYEQNMLVNETASRISWIGSVQAGLCYGGNLFMGPIFDIGGMRYLLFVGTFLTIFGIMMTSLCTQYWQFMLAQGLCTGLGLPCLLVPGVAVIPGWFHRRRALAGGLSATGASMGAIVFSVVFEQLTPRIGFRWAIRVLGFILLIVLIIPNFVLRKRIAHTPRRAMIDQSAFRESTFYLTGMFLFFSSIAQYIPFGFVQLYSVRAHILDVAHADLNKWLVVLMNCGSFLGRVLPGLLADHIGVFNTQIPCAVVSGIVALAWIKVHSLTGIIVFTLAAGFFLGSFASLIPLVIFAVSPDLRRVGTRLGMFTFCNAAGLLIGNPIAGALIFKNGTDFVPLQVYCGVAVLISASFAFAVRFMKVGLKVTVKV